MLRQRRLAVVEQPQLVSAEQPLVLPAKTEYPLDFYLTVRDGQGTSPGRQPPLSQARTDGQLTAAFSERWAAERSQSGLQVTPIGRTGDRHGVSFRVFLAYVENPAVPPVLQRLVCGVGGPVYNQDVASKNARWALAENTACQAVCQVVDDFKFWVLDVQADVRLPFETFNQQFVFDLLFDQFGFLYNGLYNGVPVGRLVFPGRIPGSADYQRFVEQSEVNTDDAYPVSVLRDHGWSYRLLSLQKMEDPPDDTYLVDLPDMESFL
jgi:hypothetical protein